MKGTLVPSRPRLLTRHCLRRMAFHPHLQALLRQNHSQTYRRLHMAHAPSRHSRLFTFSYQ